MHRRKYLSDLSVVFSATAGCLVGASCGLAEGPDQDVAALIAQLAAGDPSERMAVAGALAERDDQRIAPALRERLDHEEVSLASTTELCSTESYTVKVVDGLGRSLSGVDAVVLEGKYGLEKVVHRATSDAEGEFDVRLGRDLRLEKIKVKVSLRGYYFDKFESTLTRFVRGDRRGGSRCFSTSRNVFQSEIHSGVDSV